MYNNLENFIRSYYKKNTGIIPLHAPVFNGNEKKYVIEAIDSTYVSSVGSFVDQFEKSIAEYTGSKHAIAIVNGTSALHLSLKLAGVEENNEVITQPLSFIATANAISYCRAIPNFIDVDKETLGLSPSKLSSYLAKNTISKNNFCYNKLTGNKIAACIPMHTFGLPMYIDEITEICKQYNIPVIEDAAESLGSFYKNRHTGTFGLLGVISFNGNKIATSGGGGVILTDNSELAKTAKHISTQAKIPHKWEYVHDDIGFNYRMPNINAALLCAQLENIENFVKFKRNLSDEYLNFFKAYNNVKLIREIENSRSNYWLNTILFDNHNERDEILYDLNNRNIMIRPVWRLISNLKIYRHAVKNNLSNSEWLEKRLVNIPSSVC